MVASRKVTRAKGLAREVRYSAMKNSKRHQRTEVYDGATYKAEKDGRTAIELTVSRINSGITSTTKSELLPSRYARSRTRHLASGMMLIGQRMSSHVGQDSDPAPNRMCLRNATNSLAPVTCALHMEANDIMALATISLSSSEMISNFEMAGNSGKRCLGEPPWMSGSDSDSEVTCAASGARPPFAPARTGQ